MVLKEEERTMHDRLSTYELDPTVGLSVRPRPRKYKNNDIAIRNLITHFDNIQNPTDLQI